MGETNNSLQAAVLTEDAAVNGSGLVVNGSNPIRFNMVLEVAEERALSSIGSGRGARHLPTINRQDSAAAMAGKQDCALQLQMRTPEEICDMEVPKSARESCIDLRTSVIPMSSKMRPSGCSPERRQHLLRSKVAQQKAMEEMAPFALPIRGTSMASRKRSHKSSSAVQTPPTEASCAPIAVGLGEIAWEAGVARPRSMVVGASSCRTFSGSMLRNGGDEASDPFGNQDLMDRIDGFPVSAQHDPRFSPTVVGSPFLKGV